MPLAISRSNLPRVNAGVGSAQAGDKKAKVVLVGCALLSPRRRLASAPVRANFLGRIGYRHHLAALIWSILTREVGLKASDIDDQPLYD